MPIPHRPAHTLPRRTVRPPQPAGPLRGHFAGWAPRGIRQCGWVGPSMGDAEMNTGTGREGLSPGGEGQARRPVPALALGDAHGVFDEGVLLVGRQLAQ